MAELPSKTGYQEATRPPRPRKWLRRLGALLLALAGLMGWYLAVFYFGWQSGQVILNEKREKVYSEQLNRQISLAKEEVAQGSFELAARRLEWVLEREPENMEAQALYARAQLSMSTPSASFQTVTPTTTPTRLPTATPTSAPIESPGEELQRMRELVETEAWDKAVAALVAFQWQFPDYERQETDELLYEAYIGLSLQLMQGEQVELGLAYLGQAESLGDLPPSVADYRTWAKLYLQGIAFYDVNWGATAFYFRDLCLAAPFYQSSCERLQEALIAYGDQFVDSLDWCPAQMLFEEASLYGRSQELAEKLSLARDECLLATPTPIAPDLGTTPLTSTQPLTASNFIIPIPYATPTGN